MFWRWHSEFAFMECEQGQHAAQKDSLSQRLFGITFWGDYSGDIVSRYHYAVVQENAPDIIYNTPAMHGQGWTLDNINGHTDQLHWLVEFVANFTPGSQSYNDYPIWDEFGGDFSDWESALTSEEMSTGWWAEYAHGELYREAALYNIEVPDIGTKEWNELVAHVTWLNGDWESAYWEGADNLIAEFDMDRAVAYLVERADPEYDPTPLPEPLF